MEVQPDYRDLLGLFNKHGVEYLIVGAYALAFHGAPRFTGDIDILVEASRKNGERILKALTEFGFNLPELTVDDFQKLENVVQLGVPPVRIDLLTSLTGLTWQQAIAHKVPGSFGDVPVCYIGKAEYITNKKATGRKKDLADVEALGEE